MDSHQSDEITIRQYLLNRLDAPPEFLERLDQRMLMDDEFSEMVDIIEDEIIEEYLEGTMEPSDREAVNRHFLRPPQRKEKLRTARLLQRHLETAPAAVSTKLTPAVHWWSHSRTWAEAAACVLLIASVTYMAVLQRGSRSEIAQSGRELTKERGNSAALAQELQLERGLRQPSMVMLSLLQPGRRSPGEPAPELAVGVAVRRIHVEIALPGASPAARDIRLEAASGKIIWRQADEPPYISKGASMLILDIPAAILEPGDYQFVVTRHVGTAETVLYPFHVSTLMHNIEFMNFERGTKVHRRG